MRESKSLVVALKEMVESSSPTPRVPSSSCDFSGPVSEAEVAAAEKALGVAFPKSYRVFLKHFGSGFLHYYEIFGIPRDRLWGDVVMMNQLAGRRMPGHYIKFMDDIDDCSYYLDTSQTDSAGECPVVVIGGRQRGRIVADSFLDFLQKAAEGSF